MNANSERALNDAVEILREIANRPALDHSVRAALAAEAACLLEQIDFEKSLEETETKGKKGETFQFIMTETLEAVLLIGHTAGLHEIRLRGTEPGTDDHTAGDLMRRVDALIGDYLHRRFGRWAPSVQLAFTHHLVEKEIAKNIEPPTASAGEGHA